MKKILTAATLAICLLTLTSCSQNEEPALYIEKYQLTDSEEALLNFIGAEEAPYIAEFKLDENVKAYQINTYQIIDGEWSLISGGGGNAFTDTSGKLALTFTDIGMGIRQAVQSENNSGSSSYKTELDEYNEDLSVATSYLTDRTIVEYEKEIPLVIQIHTSKDTIQSYSPDYGFLEAERYEELGYEQVYAITVMFSEKSVGELSQ